MRSALLLAWLLAGCGASVSTPNVTDATTDSVASDAATDTAIACYDDGGTVSVDVKICTNDADCVARTHVVDCCGTLEAVGIASGSAAAFSSCEEERARTVPVCDCVAQPAKAEDGKLVPESGVVSVHCIDRTSSSGICKTFVP